MIFGGYFGPRFLRWAAGSGRGRASNHTHSARVQRGMMNEQRQPEEARGPHPAPDGDEKTPLGLWDELKRRRVVRVGITYAAVAFAVLQGADIIFPALGIPDGAFRILVIATLAAFPAALGLAWSFDLTPEGLQRANRHGGVLIGRRPIRAGIGATILVLTLLGGWSILQPTEAQPIAQGTELVAVLPFRTSGPDFENLGEGMVDLISRNLDATGEIRTLDPRTVLYSWKERGGDSGLPLAEELLLGSSMGAGSILTGSVTQLGDEVRMDAELHLVDGTRMASAQVDGTSDRLMAMVDSLSLLLVSEVWQSSGTVPRFDLSAMTSGDLDAVGAFLEGERLYRRSQWAEAIAAFRSAIAIDSTFALAYYRISNAMGWGNYPFAQAQAMAAQAAALSDRLPPRERTLVQARSAPDRAASIEILRPFVERHPDDFEGVYWLADDLYHSVDENVLLGGRPVRAQLRLFHQATELDPQFTASFIHPLEIVFRDGDRDLIRSWVEAFAEMEPSDSAALAQYRRALEALENPDDEVAMARALAAAIVGSRGGAGGLQWQASKATVSPLLGAVSSRPSAFKTRVETRLLEDVGDALDTRMGVDVVFALRSSSGQIDQAVAAMGEAGFDREAWTRLGLAGLVRLGEFPDRLGLRSGTEVLLQFVDAFDRRDLEGAREAAARLAERSLERGPEDSTWVRISASAEGLTEWLETGDSAPLERVETAVRAADRGDDWVAAFAFRWAVAAAETADLEERALAALGREGRWAPEYEPLRLHALSRLLTGRGDSEGGRLRERMVKALGPIPEGYAVPTGLAAP